MWLRTAIESMGQKQQLLRLRSPKQQPWTGSLVLQTYSAMLQIILLIESQETIHHLGTTADDCAKQLDFSEAGQQ